MSRLNKEKWLNRTWISAWILCKSVNARHMSNIFIIITFWSSNMWIKLQLKKMSWQHTKISAFFTHKMKTPTHLDTSTWHCTQTTHLLQGDVRVSALSPGAQLFHETTLLVQPLWWYPLLLLSFRDHVLCPVLFVLLLPFGLFLQHCHCHHQHLLRW